MREMETAIDVIAICIQNYGICWCYKIIENTYSTFLILKGNHLPESQHLKDLHRTDPWIFFVTVPAIAYSVATFIHDQDRIY